MLVSKFHTMFPLLWIGFTQGLRIIADMVSMCPFTQQGQYFLIEFGIYCRLGELWYRVTQGLRSYEHYCFEVSGAFKKSLQAFVETIEITVKLKLGMLVFVTRHENYRTIDNCGQVAEGET